ncbi:MAG: LysR family transcriptional regulator [Phycisphaerales bacterium]
MDTELLQTFSILAHTKNFSKTAEIQHVVQSTITIRIHALERVLGKQLFVRNKQKVELSEAGILFLPYAERMLQIYEESRFKITAMESFEARLVIGSVDSIWRNMLLPVLKEFLIRYPQVSLKAHTNHSAEVIQLLVDGVIDIAFVYQPPRIRRFEVFVCHEDDFVLVVHPNHPLAKRAFISIEELAKINLLYHNWSGVFSKWMEEVLPPNQLFQLQIDPASMILSLVKEGLGPALLTRASAAKELVNKTIVEIPLVGKPLPPVWKTYLVVHRTKLTEPAIMNWCHLMSQHNLELKSVMMS